MGEGIAIDAAGNVYTAEATTEGRDEIRQGLADVIAPALKQKRSREHLYRRMEGSMRLPPFTTTAVCSLLIALGIGLARPAWGAEIRVLNANALTIALRALAAEHTKQTGTQVTFIFGSPGQIQQKVDAGEKFDLLIMPTPALAALDTAGKLAPGTRRALVRVGIGIAIREGAPKPDITTPEALRKTLLAQQKITYSDSKHGRAQRHQCAKSTAESRHCRRDEKQAVATRGWPRLDCQRRSRPRPLQCQ